MILILSRGISGDSMKRPDIDGQLNVIYNIMTVASASNKPMLTISVAVVSTIVDAVTGSVPKRRIVRVTMTPITPLIMQAPITANITTTARVHADPLPPELA